MKDDQDLLYAVAVMYYQDGLNQEEISKRMQLSRPMVSRLLAKAQERGIVRITVEKPEPIGNLAEKLERTLELEKVYIAPNAVHSAVAVEDSLLIDMFAPMREDFL